MKIGIERRASARAGYRGRHGAAVAVLALAFAAQFGAPQAARAAVAAPLPASAVTAASNGAVPLPDGVMASVNGVAITQEQFDRARVAAVLPDTPASRDVLKNQLIARELLRQAAERAHYDTRPQVVAAVEQARTTAMASAWLHDQVRPAPVSDADVKAKYDEVVATLGDVELKPRAIVLKDRASADAALRQLKQGADFAQLARQAADGPNAAQGGALNWVSFRLPVPPAGEQNWPQPLAEALLKLPQGGVTREPVEAGGRFWILRVDEKRPTQIPSYADAKDVLRRELEQAAVQKATIAVVVDLLKQAHIQR
ncbi:peptidylprolyl isomerase [Burkholderia sp. 3C]